MKKVILSGLLIGVLILVVEMALSYAANSVFPSLVAEYNNTSLFRSWSDPLMLYLYGAYPFVMGIAFAWAWNKVKVLFAGAAAKNGFLFGLAFWLVYTIPGMLISYASFQLSLTMILSWTLSGFIWTVLSGMILAKLNR